MSETDEANRKETLVKEILELKEKHHASILAHYYEEGEIQDLADYVGDSYYLAQKGQETKAEVILLAGVVFMAESVKILNSSKKVIVPDLRAGCSLVDSSPYPAYYQWRQNNPQGVAVTYINSSAKVKAISDVICTSSNAEKIIAAIPPERPILFGPDRNLGRFLAAKSKRHFELWQGTCFVHVLFSAQKLLELMLANPRAVVIAHPECNEEVLKYAQVIGSTSRLLEEVQKNPAKQFIVATEPGIFHQMQKVRPDAEIIQAPTAESCGCNNCFFMKLNTLEKIKESLISLEPEIRMSSDLISMAKVPLERMMTLAQGGMVTWPENFNKTAEFDRLVYV